MVAPVKGVPNPDHLRNNNRRPGKYDQPSEAQEAANAAYVWRLRCESELAKAAAKDGAKFEDINFCFQRYKRAWEKELYLDTLAK